MKLLIRNNPKLLEIFWLLIVVSIGVVSLTALLSIRSWYKPAIKLNEVSPVTIILGHDVKVEDRLKTNEAREKARLAAIRNVGNKEILSVDDNASQESLAKLRFLVQMIREQIAPLPSYYDMPINQKISMETQNYLTKLNTEKFNQLLLSRNFGEIFPSDNLTTGPLANIIIADNPIVVEELNKLTEFERKSFFEELRKLREKQRRVAEEKEALGKAFFDAISAMNYEDLFVKAFAIQKRLLDLGIVHGLPRKKIQQNTKILFPFLTDRERVLIDRLIERSTYANMQIDWTKVQALEDDAMSLVEPVIIELKQGSVLATKGEIVTEQQYYYLEDLNMLHVQSDWGEILNNFYILLFLVFASALFYIFNQRAHFSVDKILMTFLASIGVSAIVAAITIWDLDKLPLAPVATMAILITVFYAPIIAMVMTTIVCFFMIKSLDMNFWQVLPHYIGSIYSVFLVRKASQRDDLTNAGTKTAIAQVTAFLLTVIIAVSDFEVIPVLIVASFYAVSGLASGVSSLAILPYLESTLRLLTPFKLAELANPNQPLLKRLRDKAPGTYEHSLNVSRLSEEAGSILGLNTDLIRVGLLYHDIGKMHAPGYFIENNFGKPNPHTTLDDPKKSAEIIIAHVAEGIKLAKKYNLPQVIIDFIPMHQGTTITNYFYHKALNKFDKSDVNSEDYRYPGPKPNSKETGIAMIADSAEAALRSIKDLADEHDAKDMIDKIIDARVKEGELEYTGLSRADLNKVAESFLNVWRSQNHERIKYPEKSKETTD